MPEAPDFFAGSLAFGALTAAFLTLLFPGDFLAVLRMGFLVALVGDFFYFAGDLDLVTAGIWAWILLLLNLIASS